MEGRPLSARSGPREPLSPGPLFLAPSLPRARQPGSPRQVEARGAGTGGARLSEEGEGGCGARGVSPEDAAARAPPAGGGDARAPGSAGRAGVRARPPEEGDAGSPPPTPAGTCLRRRPPANSEPSSGPAGPPGHPPRRARAFRPRPGPPLALPGAQAGRLVRGRWGSRGARARPSIFMLIS